MAVGIKENAPEPRVVYADIIDFPHHQSDVYPHMSLYKRAAQFAPFAALTGFEDMVDYEFRYLDQMEELNETALELLNRKFPRLDETLRNGNTPTVGITCFVPDESKVGGKYITVTEQIRKIDPFRRKIVLMKTKEGSTSCETIDMDMVSGITGDLVDSMDEYL